MLMDGVYFIIELESIVCEDLNFFKGNIVIE